MVEHLLRRNYNPSLPKQRLIVAVANAADRAAAIRQ
jgi:hypothetical protein